MRLRLLGAVLLFAISVTLFLPGVSSIAGTGIENPTCELISPGIYRIDFQASSSQGPVQVFTSARPDLIDSTVPLLTIRKAPAEVRAPQSSGRVYFHLKPATGVTRVVSIRRVPLEGAKNFRDLGGYRTSDGRYVRWGLVYRSDYLTNLTAKDSDYLNSLGIRLVCDVRADGERARSPDHWTGNAPEFLFVPIGPNRDGTLTPDELKRRVTTINAQTKDSLRGYDYAISDAQQYGKILRRIAAGDLPTVEHCTSGKDRTGVFSAILLTALGVPREEVIQDYLLTNRYLLASDSIQSTTENLQKIFGLAKPPDAATVKTIMNTRPETLEATFANIDKFFGSFDNYLRDGLKISDSELTMIRQRLLEP
ncbi:MAG TPA: tyrosine-protein phosphatase [Candidatus Dormibacteraeota bacterium]|nr:tyrosine-protein phosphatase [Candidatus Dormibacteraeota bacterium]